MKDKIYKVSNTRIVNMAKKRKIKIVYRNPSTPKTDYTKGVKEEISALENLKSKSGKGFRGFLNRASLNKQISEKRKILSVSERKKIIDQKNELGKSLVERERIKAELSKQKSQVNFKPITFDDLYK